MNGNAGETARNGIRDATAEAVEKLRAIGMAYAVLGDAESARAIDEAIRAIGRTQGAQ